MQAHGEAFDQENANESNEHEIDRCLETEQMRAEVGDFGKCGQNDDER